MIKRGGYLQRNLHEYYRKITVCSSVLSLTVTSFHVHRLLRVPRRTVCFDVFLTFTIERKRAQFAPSQPRANHRLNNTTLNSTTPVQKHVRILLCIVVGHGITQPKPTYRTCSPTRWRIAVAVVVAASEAGEVEDAVAQAPPKPDMIPRLEGFAMTLKTLAPASETSVTFRTILVMERLHNMRSVQPEYLRLRNNNRLDSHTARGNDI
jgi:hypothetical protein